MNIYLAENGQQQVRGDQLAQTVFRSDLTPMPRTLEIVFKHLDGLEDQITEGKFLWGGYELLKYRIVKVTRVKAGQVQGITQLGAIKAIAVLDACAEISYRRSRAVVRENSSLGGIFRACGGTAPVSADFPVRRFACLVGEVPSFAIAQALQEEGAAMVMSAGKVGFLRLSDMMRQTPVRYLPYSDPTDIQESEFMERHEIPSFISTGPTGAIVKGNFAETRAVEFAPYADVRQLFNLSNVLVCRRVLRAELCQEIKAGDLISIGGQPYAVITAAHTIQAAGASYDTYSKFWLGSPSQ